jgi:multicomponent Na+:H+ antiporter subunit F
MIILMEILALLLLLNLLVALMGAQRGGTIADRMLVSLLFGSTGVGLMVLLAAIMQQPALIDVALVLALLAAIAGITFARRAWHDRQE